MIIIPIGVDCGMANFLKKYKLRNCALPFDWVVSYTGVSNCICNDFNLFTNPLNNNKNIYDIYFVHDFNHENINDDTEKYNRRIQRFKNILTETTEEVIFCRKGHAYHHHKENNIVANEIEETEKLNTIIKYQYPLLKYKIILILVCGNCIGHNEKITNKSVNIEIYNISTPIVDDILFEKTMCNIFNLELLIY